QIFNRMMSGWPFGGERTANTSTTFAPAVESFVDNDGKKYHCRVALPGIDPKEVQIQALGNTLTISGERKVSHSSKEVDFLHEEISYGKFERTFTLPEGVDTDKLTAEYQNGSELVGVHAFGQRQAHCRVSKRRAGNHRARCRCSIAA